MNKQLHTVNIMDPVSMFQCELGEVASGIEAEYKKGEHFSSKEEFLDVMEKSYRIIYSRIEEDFADPNREKHGCCKKMEVMWKRQNRIGSRHWIRRTGCV